MERCRLCSPSLAPVLAQSEYWLVVLNHNQNLLGKCFLALRRHIEAVGQLTPEEWMALHEQLSRTTEALTLAFSPDHFNYAFLQNQDRHVHMHVIPRYSGPRTFAGLTFEDPDYPAHYSVSGLGRRLAENEFARLAETLQQCLAQVRAPSAPDA